MLSCITVFSKKFNVKAIVLPQSLIWTNFAFIHSIYETLCAFINIRFLHPFRFGISTLYISQMICNATCK